MPSIVPGYEYDIFISYRHNDNRSGWVTEFVKAFKKNLHLLSRIQYLFFDTNPNDGLLETKLLPTSILYLKYRYI
jgi:hypothetical protein